MFEYLNYGYIIMSGMVAVPILGMSILRFKKDKSAPIIGIIISLVIASIPFSYADSVNDKVMENKFLFNENKELKCKDSSGLTLVSLKKEWVIKDDNLIKGDKIISIQKCHLFN